MKLFITFLLSTTAFFAQGIQLKQDSGDNTGIYYNTTSGNIGIGADNTGTFKLRVEGKILGSDFIQSPEFRLYHSDPNIYKAILRGESSDDYIAFDRTPNPNGIDPPNNNHDVIDFYTLGNRRGRVNASGDWYFGTALTTGSAIVNIKKDIDLSSPVEFNYNWNAAMSLSSKGANVGSMQTNFFIDNANNRAVIQTWRQTSESSGTTADTYLYLNSNGGNVGIGGRDGSNLTNPTAKLHVRSMDLYKYAGKFENSNLNSHGLLVKAGSNTYTNKKVLDLRNNEDDKIFTAYSNGKVGIGTDDTHGAKLAVLGDVKIKGDTYTEKVTVTANVWPDYVFAPTYELMSLDDVETYIQKYQHLPNMPSEKEVKANGQDLGAMQIKLLEKIEELTLHMIQMEKKIKRLELELKD